MTGVRTNPLGPTGSPEAEVVLLPQRAVFWPSARTLLIADLHLGKCETIRAHGGPMPESILRADLDRLSAVLTRTEAARLIILGDLLHAAIGVTDWLVDVVGEWRRRHAGVEFLAVPGNHDSRLEAVADPWRLRPVPPGFADGPFAFCHHPCESDTHYIWAGHVHPLAALRSRRDELDLPCFWLAPRTGVLPAFSAFTGGLALRPRAGERLFAIAEGRVFEL
ncbi:MAG: ligase-associated DNA damage response endonuclease PdeM [Phycisphaerales bacterium]